MSNGNQTLLVEILTEELPPSSQKKMADFFSKEISAELGSAKFISEKSVTTTFSTPRRMGFKITNVASQSPDEEIEEKLMPKKIGWKDGKASAPLEKKLDALGLILKKNSISNFIIKNEKEEMLYILNQKKGNSLNDFLKKNLPLAIKKIPIDKTMSYQLDDGWTTVNFVRPVRNILCLFGDSVPEVSILGLESSNATSGHRFESKNSLIKINHADNYESLIDKDGCVIADYEKRKEIIRNQINEIEGNLGENYACLIDENLLNEVTALVEKPHGFVGSFDEKFLSIPSECLVLSMKSDQKYFPVNYKGILTNKFIMISNISPKDPKTVIKGNEKVIFPRLADAEFFFNQDKNKSLNLMCEDLKNITYHQDLGTVEDRCKRVSKIFDFLTKNTSVSIEVDSNKLALLSKADLTSLMVGEFPELQGIMGKYYALDAGIDRSFAQAIEDHYKPRFSGDDLPDGELSIISSLADKWVSLIDLFAVGEKPTGVKDPFALRRAAISIIRILIEKKINLDILNLINIFFPDKEKSRKEDLINFLYDRLENYVKDQGYDLQLVKAVCHNKPSCINDILPKIEAMAEFRKDDLSDNLAQSNKRVLNILKKYESDLNGQIDTNLFENKFEHQLSKTLNSVAEENKKYFDSSNYTELLKNLINLSKPIDQFFDNTMINSDNNKVKHNRHLLLFQLSTSMNIIGDLSVLGE